MISLLSIQKVQDAADIVGVVSDYVSLKKTGSNYRGLCPFHDDRTPSLMVSPAKNICKCFACGEGGDPISFIMKHERMSYPDAVRFLARKYDVEIAEDTDAKTIEKRKRQESLYIVIEAAQQYFVEQLANHKEAYEYAVARFGESYVKEQGIGYAPDSWDGLVCFLMKKGYSLDAAVDAGLLKIRTDGQGMYDFYRGRITIPVRNLYHKIVSFTCRILPSLANAEGKESKELPKYINGKNTEIFNKSEDIFGIETARRQGAKEDKFYLMEGAPDAMKLQSLGIANAVASLGGCWTADHFKQLKRYAQTLCFLPDSDVLHEGEDFPAGTKFVLANGELALSMGFSVSVRPIPLSEKGEKQDPDSYVTSLEVFQGMEETDYVLWAASQYIEASGDDNNKKSKAIQKIASLVAYSDSVRQEIYYDELVKIYGRRAMWKKAVTDAAITKPSPERTENVIDRDNYDKYGFWISKYSYYSYIRGEAFRWSNFIIKPLFHIKDSVQSKRLFLIQNIYAKEELIEMRTDDMISLNAFRKRLENQGNYIWYAKEEQLQKLKGFVYENVLSALEITQLGWSSKGFFAFGNGIYHENKWHEADKYGIVNLGETGSFYLPSKCTIYNDDDMLYQWERKFVHLSNNGISLEQYSRSLIDVFGNNAKVGICFYLSTLFRDIIFSRTKHFPLLNLFGPKGSGKSQLGHSLMSFFIVNNEAPNIENTTLPALAEAVAQCSNALVHFDEFKNNIDIKKREFLKGLWDGTGRTKMDMERGKQKLTSRVNSGIIVSGQEMATADIALFSRMIFLTFSKAEFSVEEQQRFNALVMLRQQGLTQITLSLLRHREMFKAAFSEAYDETCADVERALGGRQVETRTIGNWLIPLATLRCLVHKVCLPFTYDEMLSISVEGILQQNEFVTRNNEVSSFWESIRSMRAQCLISLDGDYRIKYERVLKGIRGAQTIELSEIKPILYIRISSVLAEYSRFCMQTNKDVVPDSALKYYLEISPGFIGIKNSMRFIQMRNGSPVQQVTDGRPHSVSSVDIAYCFDYDVIKQKYGLILDDSPDILDEADMGEPIHGSDQL